MQHRLNAVANDDHSHAFSNVGTVKRNERLRKCKICSKVLSSYNLNAYCFAHLDEGMLIEDEKKDRIKYKANTQHRERQEKKWQEKLKRIAKQKKEKLAMREGKKLETIKRREAKKAITRKRQLAKREEAILQRRTLKALKKSMKKQ